MYLEGIRLRNIACFEDLSLDFTRHGRPCPWVVILGENGCGKSTLLQMMALSLVGSDMIHEIAGGVEWGRFARSSTSPGRIDIELLPTSGDVIEMPQPRIFLSYAYPDRENVRRLYQQLAAAGLRPWMDVEDILPGERWEKRLHDAMRESDLILVCLSTASQDRSSHQAEVREALEISKQKDERDIYVIPVRLEPCHVTEPLNELLWVDLFQGGGFERLEEAIHTAMERRGKMLPPRGGGLESNRGGLRLRAAYEFDLHLHPNWQRSIVDEVRKLFPNLQFIVSSHSPFVAQDAGEADKIIVLKRRGQRVEADEGLDSVKGWRVDQILTSYLFDLETTRDAGIAAAEREYRTLLDRQAGGDGESADEKRIRELKEWLDQHKSAPGETVAENEIFEAARSFIPTSKHLSTACL
ncbi:MAG: TIR domain-containing protein [bacterium]|nr:TIR domain-containing protein [bacterium]